MSSPHHLYLEPYHIYPAFNYATLYPEKAGGEKDIVGFLNGTRQELEDERGSLGFIGNGIVYGFIVGTYTHDCSLFQKHNAEILRIGKRIIPIDPTGKMPRMTFLNNDTPIENIRPC